MSDFPANSVPQAPPSRHIPHIDVAKVVPRKIIRDGDVQHDEIARGLINIEAVSVGPDQIIIRPGNDAGQSQLPRQRSDKGDGHFGPRICNPEADLQFFNPVFQVRSFALGSSFGSRLDPAPGPKGRPASSGAA